MEPVTIIGVIQRLHVAIKNNNNNPSHATQVAKLGVSARIGRKKTLIFYLACSKVSVLFHNYQAQTSNNCLTKQRPHPKSYVTKVQKEFKTRGVVFKAKKIANGSINEGQKSLETK